MLDNFFRSSRALEVTRFKIEEEGFIPSTFDSNVVTIDAETPFELRHNAHNEAAAHNVAVSMRHDVLVEVYAFELAWILCVRQRGDCELFVTVRWLPLSWSASLSTTQPFFM